MNFRCRCRLGNEWHLLGGILHHFLKCYIDIIEIATSILLVYLSMLFLLTLQLDATQVAALTY